MLSDVSVNQSTYDYVVIIHFPVPNCICPFDKQNQPMTAKQ